MAILPNAYPDLDISASIPYDRMVGNSRDMRDDKMVYGVANPHPAYGKNPNILNEMGHTVYPKIVYPNGVTNPYVIVNSFDEEVKAMGEGASNQLVEKLDDDIEALEAKLARAHAMKERAIAITSAQPQTQTEKKAW